MGPNLLFPSRALAPPWVYAGPLTAGRGGKALSKLSRLICPLTPALSEYLDTWLPLLARPISWTPIPLSALSGFVSRFPWPNALPLPTMLPLVLGGVGGALDGSRIFESTGFPEPELLRSWPSLAGVHGRPSEPAVTLLVRSPWPCRFAPWSRSPFVEPSLGSSTIGRIAWFAASLLLAIRDGAVAAAMEGKMPPPAEPVVLMMRSGMPCSVWPCLSVFEATCSALRIVSSA